MNDAFTEKVEQLLTRYEQSRHVINLLERQLESVRSERDTLELRIRAVSIRVEALLERLSPHSEPKNEESTMKTIIPSEVIL